VWVTKSEDLPGNIYVLPVTGRYSVGLPGNKWVYNHQE
jgi:hypothetical protein